VRLSAGSRGLAFSGAPCSVCARGVLPLCLCRARLLSGCAAHRAAVKLPHLRADACLAAPPRLLPLFVIPSEDATSIRRGICCCLRWHRLQPVCPCFMDCGLPAAADRSSPLCFLAGRDSNPAVARIFILDGLQPLRLILLRERLCEHRHRPACRRQIFSLCASRLLVGAGLQTRPRDACVAVSALGGPSERLAFSGAPCSVSERGAFPQKSLANSVNLWYIYALVMIYKRLIFGVHGKEIVGAASCRPPLPRENQWGPCSA